MMGKLNSFNFTWILCIGLFTLQKAESLTENDEDNCERTSPCICEFDNNIVLDVTSVGSEGFINATVETQNITYYFHGCTDAVLTVINPDIKNLCANKPNALCIYEASKGRIWPLGNHENISYVNSLDESKSHELVFSNINTTASVQLVCTPELNHDVLFAFPANADGTQHRLVLQSHKVCRHTVYHGMGTGSLILVLLVGGFTIYFVGGALALHFLKGANGLEMIPNLDFWRDLPNLCKDGFLYLLSGCKTTQVPTSETYDRI